MNPGLQAGQTGEVTWVVDPTMTITLGGQAAATVFSTPSMILLMERASREALRPYLEAGEESVGAEVQVEHLAPALLGETVRGVARVTAVDGRRVGFELAAYAGERELGRGTHRRAVIRLERLVQSFRRDDLGGPSPRMGTGKRGGAGCDVAAARAGSGGAHAPVARAGLARHETTGARRRRQSAQANAPGRHGSLPPVFGTAGRTGRDPGVCGEASATVHGQVIAQAARRSAGCRPWSRRARKLRASWRLARRLPWSSVSSGQCQKAGGLQPRAR